MTDAISDLLTRIKTASMAGLAATSFDLSNLKLAVAEALKRAGYLKAVTKKGKKLKKTVEVELVYQDKRPKIQDLERVSKPSRRVYLSAKEIRSVRQGFGLGFYSTSQGIMTDKEARRAKLGGEYLFKIW
jgi:small subunit ribosomal protein S8